MTTPYKIGEMVDIQGSVADSYRWAAGRTGVVKATIHEKDFSIIDTVRSSRPPIKPAWWTVSVDDPRAKGGFAFAVVPEILLSPHSCTSRCPKHPCLLG